jgi:hypothetical protein
LKTDCGLDFEYLTIKVKMFLSFLSTVNRKEIFIFQ